MESLATADAFNEDNLAEDNAELCEAGEPFARVRGSSLSHLKFTLLDIASLEEII